MLVAVLWLVVIYGAGSLVWYAFNSPGAQIERYERKRRREMKKHH